MLHLNYIFTAKRDLLTVLCPAPAESPAHHTLEKKDKNRHGNKLSHMSTNYVNGMASLRWIIRTGQPIYGSSTISSLAVVSGIRKHKSIRMCHKQARLRKCQPKQSVEFKIMLEKKVGDHLWSTKVAANRCLVKCYGRKQRSKEI